MRPKQDGVDDSDHARPHIAYNRHNPLAHFDEWEPGLSG
jgi:hypothetical protein